MTAEVIIMNREAIALAADSAVTFQSGKIFNSANKLYMLAPNYPVGVLIYNVSSFMGVSWELLIKYYRDHLIKTGKRLNYLQDYASDFVKFLEDSESLFYPEAYQDEVVKVYIEHLMNVDIFQEVNREVQRQILMKASPLTGHDVLDIARKIINRICTEWETSPDLFDTNEIDKFKNKFTNKYRGVFDQLYKDKLDNLGLASQDKERLWQNCINWFIKERWFSSRHSGVCFAGYGDKDVYPVFTHHYFESYICDSLKHIKSQEHSGQTVTTIFPFAQTDIIDMFISGMHRSATEGLQNILSQKLNDTEIQQTFTLLHEHMRNQYTKSIMDIVQGLPKDELALMAETLVNTTSYMRRVTSSKETVGGPTDVAVISKKDGFIWIKRKHYFKPEQNYHFFKK